MLVSSPGYLAQQRPVDEPSDLSHHQCVLFALEPGDCWYFRRPSAPPSEALEVKVTGGFRANDSEVLLRAVRDDFGVALLPTWLLGEDIEAGRLVPLLTHWDCALAPGPERAIWGVYPPKKTVSPKVRAFLTFIAERFGHPPYWDRDATKRTSAVAQSPPTKKEVSGDA
jgi:DNA-binding transcriptional LysR family regulator